jgi:hypothetical protein
MTLNLTVGRLRYSRVAPALWGLFNCGILVERPWFPVERGSEVLNIAQGFESTAKGFALTTGLFQLYSIESMVSALPPS